MKRLKQTEDGIMKKSAAAQLQELLQSEKIDIAPHQMEKIARLLEKKSSNGVDVNYIRTVLFPEMYNGDIPLPLSNIAYCRFTHKAEMTIMANTAKDNNDGCLVFLPRSTVGPCLIGHNTGALTDAKLFDQSAATVGGWQFDLTNAFGFDMDYTNYFSSVALVSASISIQYIGQVQLEQGLFVGGQIYSGNLTTLSVQDIEDSQFRVVAKPSHGIRLVYMPKDDTDFSFVNTKKDYPMNDPLPSATTGVVYAQVGRKDFSGTLIPGTQTVLTYNDKCSIMAIYWKGLNPQVNNLRVEIIRRFNGIPLSKQRDYVDIQRPKHCFDQKRTTDVIFKLSDRVPQLAGHSMKDIDRVSDQIQQYLPNIGHIQEIGGDGLTGFSNQLALGAVGNGPIVGDLQQAWDK